MRVQAESRRATGAFNFLSQFVAIAAAVLLVGTLSSCAEDVGFTDGEVVIDTETCCSCACSDAGQVCAEFEVTGNENASCSQLCGQACAETYECNDLEFYQLCSVDKGKGDDPCTDTCQTLDSCEVVSYADDGACDCQPTDTQRADSDCFEEAQCNAAALQKCLDQSGSNFRNVQLYGY